MTEKADAHRALFKKFGIAFMKKDVDTVGECLSPDFEWSLPDGRTFVGKQASLDAMRERFADPDGPQFSDSNFDYHGDTIVQTYRVKAALADGSIREVAGTDVYQVKGGLICRKDAYWKQLA